MDDSWPGPQQQLQHGNNSSIKFIDPVIVPSGNNNNNNNRAKTSDGKRLLQKNGNQESSIASLPSTIQTQQGLGQGPSNQSNSGYVLRGGFKMPRQTSANGNSRLD